MNKSLDRISDEVFSADNVWTAVGFLAVVVGAGVARKLLKSGWRASTGKEPPLNPDAEDAAWMQGAGMGRRHRSDHRNGARGDSFWGQLGPSPLVLAQSSSLPPLPLEVRLLDSTRST